jgi:hypothetical protein
MASDGSIQFPPGQRREKPSFEPPPWEQDQFDELARLRSEPVPAPPLGGEAEPVGEAAIVFEDPAGTPRAPKTDGAAQAQPSSTEATEDPEGSELDPKQVEMLMMGLRSEEPRLDGTYSKITMVVGAASALIGLVLMTWGLIGVAAPKKVGAAPVFLVGVPLIFGIGFVVGGVWVVIRSLRQQGVL